MKQSIDQSVNQNSHSAVSCIGLADIFKIRFSIFWLSVSKIANIALLLPKLDDKTRWLFLFGHAVHSVQCIYSVLHQWSSVEWNTEHFVESAKAEPLVKLSDIIATESICWRCCCFYLLSTSGFSRLSFQQLTAADCSQWCHDDCHSSHLQRLTASAAAAAAAGADVWRIGDCGSL